MFRKYALGLAIVGCCASSAMAATAAGQFNVVVTLTPKCEVFNGSGATGTSTPTISPLSLAYTSFQPTPSTGNTMFQVRCTNSQSYTMDLDQTDVTDGTTGLSYTLNLANSSTYASTPNKTLSATGNGLNGQTYYVHATVPAAQDGTVSTSGTANNVRSLTITY